MGFVCSSIVWWMVFFWLSFVVIVIWVWLINKMVLFIIRFSKIIKLIMVSKLSDWKVNRLSINRVSILFVIVNGMMSKINVLFLVDLNNVVISKNKINRVKIKLIVIFCMVEFIFCVLFVKIVLELLGKFVWIFGIICFERIVCVCCKFMFVGGVIIIFMVWWLLICLSWVGFMVCLILVSFFKVWIFDCGVIMGSVLSFLGVCYGMLCKIMFMCLLLLKYLLINNLFV